ncbi:hypothetical protein [Catenulispora sp. GP43]|uniref:hypothetical protein n=1 Tax=Catenulispora sp. GP43 TaxID=3156263 RepID=UPI0035167682
MEERDELEIETRLRAALQARSELVTHSTLRPGIPPNEHTAGVRAKRDAWWSWRRIWAPVTVAAALAGGVFVGAQLPSDSGKGSVSAGSNPGSDISGQGSGAPTGSAPTPGLSAASGTASNIGTLGFTLADGWQVTAISDTAGCVTPKTRPAPNPAAAGTDSLPCGVDGLYIKADAAPTAWPLSAATKDIGWWPGQAASASAITCPAVKPGGSGMVKASMVLRSSAKYALAGQATAEYHEWAVTCDNGPGVQPMLWKLNAAPGATAPTTFGVAAVVSSDPEYDSALLGMVGSLHQTS